MPRYSLYLRRAHARVCPACRRVNGLRMDIDRLAVVCESCGHEAWRMPAPRPSGRFDEE